MEQEEVAITTFDNPFSPFTEFEIWLKMDLLLGHDTCGALEREANTSDVASDDVNDKMIEEAIGRLCSKSMIYKKVKRKDYV